MYINNMKQKDDIKAGDICCIFERKSKKHKYRKTEAFVIITKFSKEENDVAWRTSDAWCNQWNSKMLTHSNTICNYPTIDGERLFVKVLELNDKQRKALLDNTEYVYPKMKERI